jgi:hypothetical protein
MPDFSSKIRMDALSDQAMAAAGDMRAARQLADGADDPLTVLADAMADLLRGQFPGETALGRITLAVAVAYESTRSTAAEDFGLRLGRREMAAVAGMAAERLDRDADHG